MHETAEISYDLVMEEDMHAVEGTYRLPGAEWQVMIFSAREEIDDPVITPNARWMSGITGVHVEWPRHWPLNKAAVEHLMSSVCKVRRWIEVRGPDSIKLR
jgi:hypothetical protein